MNSPEPHEVLKNTWLTLKANPNLHSSSFFVLSIIIYYLSIIAEDHHLFAVIRFSACSASESDTLFHWGESWQFSHAKIQEQMLFSHL